jgi:hypothetical protein
MEEIPLSSFIDKNTNLINHSKNSSPEKTLQLQKNIYSTFESLEACLKKSIDLVLSRKLLSHFDLRKRISKIFSSFDLILENFFPEWQFLQSQEYRYFCEHTFLTMVVLYKHSKYIKLPENDQMLLMWTMLFHDIHKRGRPVLDSRDPFHPFPSAMRTLEILIKNEILPKNEYLNEFRILIESSFELDRHRLQIMSYTNIDQIFKGFLFFTGLLNSMSEDFKNYRMIEERFSDDQRFYFEMLILILFHQSLNINPFFPNPSYLNEFQVEKYLSPRLVKLLHIVHLADHNSYNIGNYQYNQWPNDKEIKRMVSEYLELFKINQY